jgi:CRP-like cAMP-binding protein
MDFLRSIEIFASMSPEQLYEAARMMHEQQLAAGEYLAREGDHGNETFIVVDGAIEVVRRLDETRSLETGERVIHTARRGEAIGEFAILASIPRSAGLRAGSETTIIALPAAAFQDLLRRHPDLSLRVMDLLVRKVVAQNRNM